MDYLETKFFQFISVFSESAQALFGHLKWLIMFLLVIIVFVTIWAFFSYLKEKNKTKKPMISEEQKMHDWYEYNRYTEGVHKRKQKAG
jgi:hypothetical protein